MDTTTRRIIAVGAMVAPLLHSITDLMEWLQGGFSPFQLWLNYLAFLPLPAIMIGLYAVQRPTVPRWGLYGSLLYGFAFVYFTFTTLKALSDGTSDYAKLWGELGYLYTFHGGLMIVGGAMFGAATLKARQLPAWTPLAFLGGLALNLLLTFMPVADLYQTLGTALRNAGLIGMGYALFGTKYVQPRLS